MYKKLRFTTFIKITILSVALSFRGLAQDVHFSQFYNSPATLNSAMTGNFDGKWRFVDNYRIQWFTLPVPFISNAISVDKKILYRDKTFGTGLLVVNDKSGDISLQVNKAYFNASMLFNFKNSFLSVGLQPGIVLKSFNSGSLTFPDQYDPRSGNFDPSLPTSGSYQSDKLQYFDLNAGLYYFYKKENKAFEVGLSGNHLYPVAESFLSSGFTLPMRFTAFTGMSFFLRNTNIIQPQIYYSWISGASELVAGSNMIFPTGSTGSMKAIIAGAFFRTGIQRNIDAAIFSGGLQMTNLLMSLSYDVTVSGMQYANYFQGAIELALIYIIHDKSSETIKVPCQSY